MAQNQTLPLSSGLGAIKAPSLQGDANEAAFRKDAASGGMLGKLLSMYPTQTEAINARKSAQEGILQAIKNLTSGTGSINPNLAGAAMDGTGISGMPDPSPFDIFDPDPSEKMPLTGDGDLGGSNEDQPLVFSGDPNLNVDIGAAGLGVEPPADSGGSTPSTATTGGAGSGEEAGGLSETNANQALVFSGSSQDAGDKKEYKSPYEEAIAQAMKSYEDTKSGKDTGVKGIEYYKDEFSKATGIDISGEADNRAALMAFGLALMQNKAGRGFDVGNILGAVGAAGEKALPVMEKARQERRAGQIAAGKYALEQRAKDKATVLATEQAALTRLQDLQKAEMDRRAKERLELIKGMQTRKTERLKTELKMLEDGEGGNLEFDKTYNLPFATGQGAKDAFDIIMAYDKKSPNKPVIIGAEPMVRKYIDGRAGVQDAKELLDVMESAARDIAQGGGTAKLAFDRLASVSKALFPDQNVGKPTSEKEYVQAVNALMGRFKRFMTQETGNGISNVDVSIWTEEIMKKPTWFTNLDETLNAVNLLRDLFDQKLNEFDQGLDHLYDAQNHVDAKDLVAIEDKYGTLDQIKGVEGKLIFKDGKIIRG
tara:strand:+ start:40 stop:1830 length:1791 start_codon:yes stop_codon:yes gene_type:complete